MQRSAVTSAPPARMPVHRLLASAFLALGSSTVALASTPPAGLSATDWESLRAQVIAAQHVAEPLEDGRLVAVNPAHGIRVEYRPDGATSFSATHEGKTWQGSLRLIAYGYRALQPVERPRRVEAGGATVTYTWDDTVAEWWSNSPQGLEQGFTLVQPPAGRGTHGPLRLAMTWHGELQPRAQGDGAVFVDATGDAVFTYAGLHTWDANGKALPTRLALAGSTLTLLVDDTGAEYPVTVDPWVQQAYLKASNTEADDQFGWSVAISGDTVVVGAPAEDSSATGVDGNQGDNSAGDSGAAYVFVRSGSSWSQQAYLKASNTGTFDQFGHSVAISGDTVVVGAFLEDSNATGVDGNQGDNSATESGAAYVFVRSGSSWSQQAYLKASNTGTSDRFGWSVAISGDTAVVGAFDEDSNATGVDGSQADALNDAGAAYVFVRSGSSWSQQAYLKASNTGEEDLFGWSVAVSGDTAVVGAVGEDSNATGVDGNQADNTAGNSGAAYVFVRSGSTWSQQAYLKASNTGAGDQFGQSVAIFGDTMVIAAPREDSNATGVNGDQTDDSANSSGAAYVFVRSGSSWSQQAYLKASNTGATDEFGYSVAISGDAVVAGAFGEDSTATGVNGNQADNSASESGGAYVFVRSGSSWSQQTYLKASNTGTFDRFGYSVAISGDTLVVGAPLERSNATGVDGNQADDSASFSGAAYVFHFTRPDLSLTKADGGASVAPGGTVAYALAYANNGSAGATGVTLTETVPANTTFNPGASTAGWSCLPDSNAGSTCVLAIGDVAATAGSSATFAVTVANPLPAGVTEISNTATIADDGTNGTDLNPGDNAAADTTPVTGAPDLSLTKSDAGASSAPGGTVAYTLSYANTGNRGASGVALTETVPANTTFNPGASTAGWSCVPNNNAGSTCTLAIGAVAGGGDGGAATFAVTVDDPLPLGVTEISNSASIADDGSNGTDPTPGDNAAADTTPIVVPTPNVSATKTASPGPHLVGDPLTYTIVLSNAGPGAQSDNPGDELLDVLPASLALVSANATSGTAFANLATNTVTWNGAIPAAGAVTVTIQATILPAAAGTTVVNQGDVAFDGDANGTNESTVTTDDPAAGGNADATAIQVAGSSVVEIPTLGEVGLLLLLFGLAALSLVRLRHARRI
jgi:uncharacterized repeat protein (TIGR01451 family)